MAITEVGTRSVAVLTAAGGDQNVNNTTHTTVVGTDRLVCCIAWEGAEGPNLTSPCQFDATGTPQNLTLIGDTGDTGSNSDVRALVYEQISPNILTNVTARTAYAGSGSPAVAIWFNLSGTNVNKPGKLLSAVSNTDVDFETVFAEGGSSGDLIFTFGAGQNFSLFPANVSSFTELVDAVTASTTSDFAYNLSMRSGGPVAPSIQWNGTDENAGIMFSFEPELGDDDWSESAFRFAVAGLPDPSTTIDSRQFHHALALQAFPQPGDSGLMDLTLGSFTVDFDGTYTAPAPSNWTYSDRLAIALIPWPDSGFTDQTRLTIGAAPGVSDTGGASTDIDGIISTTMSGFTLDFDGTTVNPSSDGSISTTLGGFATSFVGEHYYNLFFDIGYALTPAWVFTEVNVSQGAMTPTLAGFTVDFDGTVLPADSTTGSMSPTLSGFGIDFDGTFTQAPTVSGSFSLDIEVFNASLRGSVVPPDGVIGEMSFTLGGFSASLLGTSENQQVTGSFALTLADVGINYIGSTHLASDIVGGLYVNPDGFSMSFRGISENRGGTKAIQVSSNNRRIAITSDNRKILISDDI